MRVWIERNERELRGEGSIHATMQSFYPPELCDLVDQRIDVLAAFGFDDDGDQLRWCQGKVIEVHPTMKDTVKVLWDGIPDCAGWENPTEDLQLLLPSKWNKDIVGAWRMDLAIEFHDTSDEEDTDNEDEGNVSEDEMEMSDSNSDCWNPPF